MGKDSCSPRQLQGPWQRLSQAWSWPLMDLTWSLPGPMGVAWSPKEISLWEGQWCIFHRGCSPQFSIETAACIVPKTCALKNTREILRNYLSSISSLPLSSCFPLRH
jgi:hypothetical protein